MTTTADEDRYPTFDRGDIDMGLRLMTLLATMELRARELRLTVDVDNAMGRELWFIRGIMGAQKLDALAAMYREEREAVS